jgi:membrane fusion protein (multidrug efflux system)
MDHRDYQVAVDRARAELNDALANASAATTGIPLTEVTTETGVRSGRRRRPGGAGGVSIAQRQSMQPARNSAAAQGRLRERKPPRPRRRVTSSAEGTRRKEEIAQQQYDAAVAAADAARAAADAARSDVGVRAAAIAVAKAAPTRREGTATQAQAALSASRTGPQQVRVTRARADVARAPRPAGRRGLAQAELNLQRASIVAPCRRRDRKKSIEVGQVVQPGQPLFAAGRSQGRLGHRELQGDAAPDVRPGQRRRFSVDALGHSLNGRVDSIAAATGAKFSMLPPENATGNYVKVVQRVPVKI